MLGIGCPDRHALLRITSSNLRRPRRVLPSRASGFVLRRNSDRSLPGRIEDDRARPCPHAALQKDDQPGVGVRGQCRAQHRGAQQLVPLRHGWCVRGRLRTGDDHRDVFSTDRPLDRSRMQLQAELVLDQLCQFARPDRLAWDQPRCEKGQHLALELVRTARASFFLDKSCDACLFEVQLRLVKGRAG